MSKVIFGGSASKVNPADVPVIDLPRHPITGEVRYRRDAMGVPRPVKVRIIEIDADQAPTT